MLVIVFEKGLRPLHLTLAAPMGHLTANQNTIGFLGVVLALSAYNKVE